VKPEAAKVLREMGAYCTRTKTPIGRLTRAAGVGCGFPDRLRAGGGRPETFAKIRDFMAANPDGVAEKLPTAQPEDDVMAETGSKSLLLALLRYGKRNDSDLGMGYEAFMAAYAQHVA